MSTPFLARSSPHHMPAALRAAATDEVTKKQTSFLRSTGLVSDPGSGCSTLMSSVVGHDNLLHATGDNPSAKCTAAPPDSLQKTRRREYHGTTSSGPPLPPGFFPALCELPEGCRANTQWKRKAEGPLLIRRAPQSPPQALSAW